MRGEKPSLRVGKIRNKQKHPPRAARSASNDPRAPVPAAHAQRCVFTADRYDMPVTRLLKG